MCYAAEQGVVGHYDECLPERAVEVGYECEDFVAVPGVEASGGFVGEDDAGSVHECAGDGDSLLLSARHLVRHMFLMLSKIYKIQHLIRFF